MFRPNYTLDKAVSEAMKTYNQSISERVGVRVRMLLLPREKREELEKQITALAVSMGAIASTGGPVFAGSWITDLLDWFIANWEVILEVILAIISIFMSQES